MKLKGDSIEIENLIDLIASEWPADNVDKLERGKLGK
jgi:hypothetical protein